MSGDERVVYQFSRAGARARIGRVESLVCHVVLQPTSRFHHGRSDARYVPRTDCPRSYGIATEQLESRARSVARLRRNTWQTRVSTDITAIGNTTAGIVRAVDERYNLGGGDARSAAA